jgi:hypothetical protein
MSMFLSLMGTANIMRSKERPILTLRKSQLLSLLNQVVVGVERITWTSQPVYNVRRIRLYIGYSSSLLLD